MAASSYGEALKRVLEHEGGDDDDPRDPGGRTSRGVTQSEWAAWRASRPGLPSDVWQAPQAQIEAIYRQKYWDALGCDSLPAGVDYCTFDYGVNSGIGRAARVLKKLKGTPAEIINAMCDERLAFLQGLGTWSTFGRGWSRRVREVRAASLAMASSPPVSAAPTKPSDLATRIVAAMRKAGAPVDEGADVVNIVYVEGMDTDGTPNRNRRNAFDDIRVVVRVVDGTASILGIWEATIETGEFFTLNPIADDGRGAARITFGYQRAWQVGMHRGQYEALIQTGGPVSVYRDDNKDFKRDGDKITTGWYGINQHHGYNAPRDNIGKNSAGCLVGRMTKGHGEFMSLVKSDKRYKANYGFIFGTTVLTAAQVMAVNVPSDKPAVASIATGSFSVGAVVAAVTAWFGAHPYIVAICAAAATVATLVAWHMLRGKDLPDAQPDPQPDDTHRKRPSRRRVHKGVPRKRSKGTVAQAAAPSAPKVRHRAHKRGDGRRGRHD